MPDFCGFHEPEANWSKLPHELIDAFPIIETLGESLVIVYVLRHTWGFGDDEKWITMDEFMHGRKRKDGTRLDHGTGLTAPTIRDGLVRAIKHGFLDVRTDDSDKARIRHYYSLRAWQGERSFPPPLKKFSPTPKEVFQREKDSLDRSEKETLREKPERETNEIDVSSNPEFLRASEIAADAMNAPLNGSAVACQELFARFPNLELWERACDAIIARRKRTYSTTPFRSFAMVVERLAREA